MGDEVRVVFPTIEQHRVRPTTTRSSPVTVYTDASKGPERTSIGVIFRRHTGDYLGMYASEISAECATRAEFHAINHALKICAQTDGADHITVRTDANAVVSALESPSVDSWMGAYGRTTQGLASNFDYCTVEAIDRDDNKTADKLCDVIKWAERKTYCSMDGEWLDPTHDLEPAELDHYPPSPR